MLTRSRWSRVVRRAAIAILFCLPWWAHGSTCRNIGSSDKTTPNTLLTLPSITVASDAPVGQILWSQSDIAFTVHCSSGILDWATIVQFWRQDLTLPAYGLELLLTYNGDRGSGNTTISTGIKGENVDLSGTVNLELRKTGTTPSQGTVAEITRTLFYLTGGQNQNADAPQVLAGLNNISFVSYTCDIDTGSRSMTVPLGDVRVDRFTGMGSTYGDLNFNIGLTCTQPSGTYNVALTFSATADSSGASGVLAITQSTDAASGVGIQLLMSSSPVTFDTVLDAGSATAGATMTIPMTARYYQTGSVVTPGAANGIATFTISYK
ncbi:fimbrial protein [Paraburkholderia sp. IMGN_8]|uniref:fimbrial protein n=1 Tax=Paraburkholderia sp. IMGN_8 TaxID=3136564 RepID=UPI0031011357